MTPFLTAVWSDLILISYAVPDEAVLPYLPPGLVPDKWEGSAWCSLVAFDFTQTRVLGWSVPYPKTLCDFPEFNLRLYARQDERRGVVFVRELISNPLVAGMAKLIYNEPYSVVPITSRVTQAGDVRRVRHDFRVAGRPQVCAVTAHGTASVPDEGGFETWVKEQEAGFNRSHTGRLTSFRVWHPAWRTYPVESVDLSVDFGLLYGDRWRFLQGRAPDSVVLAEGSQIAIYPNETH